MQLTTNHKLQQSSVCVCVCRLFLQYIEFVMKQRQQGYNLSVNL